ncbi:hypothetical protein I310_02103 [Cryptococcus deuterogattii CA1014]|nr:hypothetical protein I310_02103 [Cryptococcus deuterogattii CA1014]
MRSEVWNNSYSAEIFDMSTPPPVPARSRLRDAPPPKIDTAHDAFSSPRLSAGNPDTSAPVTPSTPDLCVPAISTISTSPLSPYFRKASLQVDSVNPSTTPRLRSPSTPSFTFPSSLLGSPSGSGPLSSFAKKRQSKMVEKDPRDPYKVKDGVQKKKAASGIYTPPTFPGPSGLHLPLPQQSHSLDTPGQHSISGLGLGPMYPTSLSLSTQSSSSDHPDFMVPQRTPMSPNNGRFGRTFSGNVRRLSSMTALTSGMTSPGRLGEEETGGTRGGGGQSQSESRKGSSHSHSYSHTYSYYTSGTPSLESSSSYDPHSSLEHYSNPQPLVSSPVSLSGSASASVSALTPTNFYAPSLPSSSPSAASLGIVYNVEEESGEDGMEGGGKNVSRPSPQTKGRRKPVPRLSEEEDKNVAEKMEALQVGL